MELESLDGLAAVGVLSLVEQDHISDLVLLGVVASGLPRSNRRNASHNWVGRNSGWAFAILSVLVFGAVVVSAILERIWQTPFANRVVPDLLYVLAIVLWIGGLAPRVAPFVPTKQ